MNPRWTCTITITAMNVLCLVSMIDATVNHHSLSYVVAAASGVSAVAAAVGLGKVRSRHR